MLVGGETSPVVAPSVPDVIAAVGFEESLVVGDIRPDGVLIQEFGSDGVFGATAPEASVIVPTMSPVVTV